MKQFTKISNKTNSLKSIVYSKILEDIKTCALYPGDRFGINELSERFQIGITPVREALQQLEAEGFVISMPRYGYIITPVTIHDIIELFEVRLVLETASVKMAIQRASDEQIRRILELSDFSYEYRDRKSYSEFLSKNIDFHCAISEASGNFRLNDMLRGVNTQLDRVYYLGLDIKDSTNEMRNEHLEIARAIAEHDLERAEKSIRQQILRSKERVIDALSKSTN